MMHDDESARVLSDLAKAAPALMLLAQEAPALTAALMSISGLQDRIIQLEEKVREDSENRARDSAAIKDRLAALEKKDEEDKKPSETQEPAVFQRSGASW